MADAAGRKLQKVKRDGEEWFFAWQQGSEIHTFKCSEAADPDLGNALKKLHKPALEALPFVDKEFHNKVQVYGLISDWKGDNNRRNTEVLVAVDLGIGKGYSKLKTPKKLADENKEEAKKARWDQNAITAINIVEEEAFAYIDGKKRAQQTMPLVDKKEKGLFDAAKAGKDLDEDTTKAKRKTA